MFRGSREQARLSKVFVMEYQAIEILLAWKERDARLGCHACTVNDAISIEKAGGFAVVVGKDHRPDSIISILLKASDVRVGM